MAQFPHIQIIQQFGRIGIQTQNARLQYKPKQSTIQISRIPGQLDIRSPRGQLLIDGSKEWSALGLENNLTFMNHVYGQSKQLVLKKIARIVDNGRRMADIVHEPNAIADIAREQAFHVEKINYFTRASQNNVKIRYIVHKPVIHFRPGKVEGKVYVSPMQAHYQRYRVNVYMRQYAKVTIIPPRMDQKV